MEEVDFSCFFLKNSADSAFVIDLCCSGWSHMIDRPQKQLMVTLILVSVDNLTWTL